MRDPISLTDLPQQPAPMNLSNNFLLSVPYMEDPNFQHTLTYLVEHGDKGALGFVVNRSIGIDLDEVLRQMEIDMTPDTDLTHPVLAGGPVSQEHGVLLFPTGYSGEMTQDFGHGVSINASREILVDIANGQGPEQFLMILGYSGWAPGQLEQELSRDAWLHCEADFDILFRTELDDRLTLAASSIGIDLAQLAPHSGRA